MRQRLFLALTFFLLLSWNAQTAIAASPSGCKHCKKINLSLREELSTCSQINALLKEHLKVTEERTQNGAKRIELLERESAECLAHVNYLNDLVEEMEKKEKSLRRRVAGQIYITWAVSAASGAMILFLLF